MSDQPLQPYPAPGQPIDELQLAEIKGAILAKLRLAIGKDAGMATKRDWYMAAVEEGFHQRAAPFYRFSPIPPFAPTTTFEWAIGGDKSAAYGVARRVMDLV